MPKTEHKSYSLDFTFGDQGQESEIQREFPLDLIVSFLGVMLRLEEC